MYRKAQCPWLIAGMCSIVFAGCETDWRRPYSDNPLLLDKNPVNGQLTMTGPDRLASSEPSPPPTPSRFIPASAEVADKLPASPSSARVVDATPAVRSQAGPVQARPTSQRNALTETASNPPIRRQVPEIYGHAANYSWLQGVLDRDIHGRYGLRYCDPGTEDRWGGKAFFNEDPRLSAFHPGDMILVKGELLPSQQTPDAWQRFPSYRVERIWLSERK